MRIDNAPTVAISLAMAASALPFSTFDTREDASFFNRVEEHAETLEHLRAQLRARLEYLDVTYPVVEAEANKFIDVFRKGIEDDPDYDLDTPIDTSITAERHFRNEKAEIIKRSEAAIRLAAKKAPERLALLNEAQREFSWRYDQVSALFRDTRWKLMALQAEFEGGSGVGPMHGTGESPRKAENAS